jgi:hypothetical protein
MVVSLKKEDGLHQYLTNEAERNRQSDEALLRVAARACNRRSAVPSVTVLIPSL